MERVPLDALLAAVNGKAVRSDNTVTGFDRVETDTRTLRGGSLFWALKGENHDAHNFIDEAVAKNAAASVVERKHADRFDGPAIVVDDTLKALWNFAHWYRQQQEALIVGVTGSVGKTTTREMIYAALGAGHAGTRSPQNYNNHVGLPLSLLDIQRKHEFAVLEMGASHVGEIRDLAAVALPEVGVVTAIGAAHLEGFGTEQRIIEAKGELIESLPANGFAVLNGDDANVRSLRDKAVCPVLLVGEEHHNDLRAETVAASSQSIAFRVDNQLYEINATGRHHITAALSAIAVAREVGLDAGEIARGLKTFQPVDGRCRIEHIGSFTVIDDTYNASPSSMQAACNVLANWTAGGRKLLVAGDMLELGNRTHELHRQTGQMAAHAGIDHLLAVGNNAAHTVRGALNAGLEKHRIAECTTIDAALAVLDCWLEPGDVVLVKGSRAMRMERVIDRLRANKQHAYKEYTSRAPSREIA